MQLNLISLTNIHFLLQLSGEQTTVCKLMFNIGKMQYECIFKSKVKLKDKIIRPILASFFFETFQSFVLQEY